MSLIDQIRMAQRDAGEAAVMADLKRKGLLIDEPKEPIMTDDATQQSQPNQIEAHMQAILNGQARDKAIAERDAALAECERLRADAEPVAGLLKPPSMAESGDKTVVDMSRLPKFHDDEAADYLSRAYKLSKQLTDHLSVSPSQRKNLTAIGWCRVGVIGSETLPFTITQVPRVAEIWREQGLEVLEVFTHPPEADTLLQQALEALEYRLQQTRPIHQADVVMESIRTYLENKA